VIARPDWDLPVAYAPVVAPSDETRADGVEIPLDREAIERDLGPKGGVARVLSQYEDCES
jgi:hypothetical protein